jgi:predicted transcriptional regulator
MTTGQMLCLSGNELDSNKQTLDQLVSDGLLIAESFKGGYSLTETGFDAMRNLAGAHA